MFINHSSMKFGARRILVTNVWIKPSRSVLDVVPSTSFSVSMPGELFLLLKETINPPAVDIFVGWPKCLLL